MTTFNSEGLKPAQGRVGFFFKMKLSGAADPFQDGCSGPGAEAHTPRPGAVTAGILCAPWMRASEGPPWSEMSPDQQSELRGGMQQGISCLGLLWLGIYYTLFIQRVSLT